MVVHHDRAHHRAAGPGTPGGLRRRRGLGGAPRHPADPPRARSGHPRADRPDLLLRPQHRRAVEDHAPGGRLQLQVLRAPRGGGLRRHRRVAGVGARHRHPERLLRPADDHAGPAPAAAARPHDRRPDPRHGAGHPRRPGRPRPRRALPRRRARHRRLRGPVGDLGPRVHRAALCHRAQDREPRRGERQLHPVLPHHLPEHDLRAQAATCRDGSARWPTTTP